MEKFFDTIFILKILHQGNPKKPLYIFKYFGYTLSCFYLLLLSACAPKFSGQLPIEEANEFTFSGNAVIPEKWWTTFEDESLNKLVDSALSNNLNLLTTWEQFQAASAVRKREFTFLLPGIEASARAGMSRPKPDFAGGENIQMGLSTSYEVDLWGRIKASVQAEEYRMQASYQDYQAAAISLSAEIADIWYQLVTAYKQLELSNEQIQTNNNIIKLIKVRFGAGQFRGVDILRQTQLLEATKDQKVIYETNIALLRNQLAILLGKPPQNLEQRIIDSLPALPPKPASGLPLELIRRRPDIQRSYDLLMAADRDYAEAVRNRFPRISIDISAQVRSNNYGNLFQEWAYSLVGNVVAPIFYWGRLKAEQDRSDAVKNQSLYQYGQTVLNAFREVEDALVREQKQAERIEILQRRLDLSAKTNRQMRIEYINGLSEYLDILLALDEQQQLQRDLLQAKQGQLAIRINLYRALAGNFEIVGEEVTYK